MRFLRGKDDGLEKRIEGMMGDLKAGKKSPEEVEAFMMNSPYKLGKLKLNPGSKHNKDKPKLFARPMKRVNLDPHGEQPQWAMVPDDEKAKEMHTEIDAKAKAKTEL